MQISDSSIKDFRVDFAKAVKALEDKYGVNVNLGPITYESNNFRGKLTVKNGAKVAKVVKKAPLLNVGNVVKIDHKKVSINETWTVVKVNKLTSKLKNTKTGKVVKCSNILIVKA